MTPTKKPGRSVFKIAANVIFYSFFLLLIFNTDAKSWILMQLVSIGLFKAEIKKQEKTVVSLYESKSLIYMKANGQLSSTADLKGKIIFINFWASWCPPCVAEMPSLNALYNKFENDERFVFLFINEDEQISKAEHFLTRNKFSIPIHRRSGKAAVELYNGTLPTTLVLNKEGKVVFIHEGLAAYNTEAFIQQLKSLL